MFQRFVSGVKKMNAPTTPSLSTAIISSVLVGGILGRVLSNECSKQGAARINRENARNTTGSLLIQAQSPAQASAQVQTQMPAQVSAQVQTPAAQHLTKNQLSEIVTLGQADHFGLSKDQMNELERARAIEIRNQARTELNSQIANYILSCSGKQAVQSRTCQDVKNNMKYLAGEIERLERGYSIPKRMLRS